MRRTVLFFLLIQLLLLATAIHPLGAQYWYEPPKKRLTIGGSLVDALADFQRQGGQVDEILTPDDLAGKPPLTYGIQNGRAVFAISGGKGGGLAGLVTVDGSSIQANMTPDGFLRLAPDQTGVRNRNVALYKALFPDQDLSEYTTEAVFEYIDETGKRFLFGGSEDGKTTAFLFKKDPTTGELVYKVERDIARAKEAKAGWVAPDESATFPVRFKVCNENRDDCVVRNFIKKPGDEIRINPTTQALKITFNKDILPYRNKYGNAQRLGWACEFKGEGFYFTYREGFMGGDSRRLPNRIGNLTCNKNELCCQRTGPGQKCHFDVKDYLDDPPNMMLFALNWLTSRLDRHKQHFTLTVDPLIKDHLRVTKFENLGCIKTAEPLSNRGTFGNDVPDRIYHSLKSALCPSPGGECAGSPDFTVLKVTGVGQGTTLIDERTGVKLKNVTMAKVYILRRDYGSGKRGDFVGAIVDNRAGGAIISTLLNMEDQPRAPDLLDKKDQVPPENIEAMLAEMKKEEEAEEIQREILASRQRALVLFPARHGWGFASQPKDAKKVAAGRRPARIVLLPPAQEPSSLVASAPSPAAQNLTSRYHPSSSSSHEAMRAMEPMSPMAAPTAPRSVAPPPDYGQPLGYQAYGPQQQYSQQTSPQSPSYRTGYTSSSRTSTSSRPPDPRALRNQGQAESRSYYSSYPAPSPYGTRSVPSSPPSTQAYGPRSAQSPVPSARGYQARSDQRASAVGSTYSSQPPYGQSGNSEAYRYSSSYPTRGYQTAPSSIGAPPRQAVSQPYPATSSSNYYRTASSEVTPAKPPEQTSRETANRRVPLRLPIKEEAITPTIRKTALGPSDEHPIIRPAGAPAQAAVQEPREVERPIEPVAQVEERAVEHQPPKKGPVLVTPSLVREVQQRLKRQGYRIRYVDGRLGPETTKAIWRFQQDVSLQPTGRINRTLLTSLGIEAENGWHTRKSSTSSSYSKRQTKKLNPSREQIKEVQRRLALIGFKPGPADGLLGSQTVRALKRFQRHAGLKPTGRINKEVLKRLSITQ